MGGGAPIPLANGDTSVPPPTLASLPPAQPGRGDLLASIKGAGIHQLKKADPNASANAPSAGGGGRAVPSRIAPLEPQDTGTTTATGTTGSGSGGGDLTSALAAALLERNKRLGDSDDDEDDDDEDWD